MYFKKDIKISEFLCIHFNIERKKPFGKIMFNYFKKDNGTVLWTLWERERVGRFGRMALKHVKYHV